MPYLGKSPQHGNYSKLDDFSGDFDGSDATHAIASNGTAITPVRPEALIISINGVIQEPVTDYTVSGTNITFTTAPTAGDNFFGVAMGEQLQIGTPSDGTITSAKLSSAVLTGHTDIGAAIADADLLLVDDGAGGTLRKTAASRIKTYVEASAMAVTGNVTATGTVEPAGDTAAGDNAAIGYTAGEGLILTGQGSTSDITIKNDADANVMTVATGTTVAAFASAPTGIITDQFKVRGGGQTDVTGDGTDYTLIFTSSEIYDAGGVFTTSTYTASVAGKAHLAFIIEAGPFASGHNRLLLRCVTSNRTNTVWDCNPYSVTNDGGTGVSSYNRWCGSIITDMDASDTATITLYVSGGAKVIDTGTAPDDCQFSGYLIKD